MHHQLLALTWLKQKTSHPHWILFTSSFLAKYSTSATWRHGCALSKKFVYSITKINFFLSENFILKISCSMKKCISMFRFMTDISTNLEKRIIFEMQHMTVRNENTKLQLQWDETLLHEIILNSNSVICCKFIFLYFQRNFYFHLKKRWQIGLQKF